jgi:enterochelin esterase family protein
MRILFLLVTAVALCLVLPACQANDLLTLPTDTPAPATVTPQPAASPTPSAGTIAGFDNFLAQALTGRPDRRQDLASRYVGQLEQAPVTGGDEAVFLYRGAVQTVQVLGDMNNWDILLAPQMTRLEGSDLWIWRSDFESDARLDYRFLVNGRELDLDPLNPNTAPGPQGPNSELRMPDYHTPPELTAPVGQIPQGTITLHTLDSQHLEQTRTFQIYEPPGQIVGQPLPSVYINGGSDYLNLIVVTPIIATDDYALNDAYADFLATELVPYVQQNFDASVDPAATGILGNSLGGLAAVHTTLNHSDVFGAAVAQSGRFGQDDDALIRYAGRRAGLPGFDPPLIYMVVGAYETAVAGNDTPQNILEANRDLAETLDSAGIDYRLDERPEGHSWGLWRGSFGRALAHLFQTES